MLVVSFGVAQPAGAQVAKKNGDEKDAAITELRLELETLRAEVARLKREANRTREIDPQTFMKATVGKPAQRENLRPGEVLRFQWDDKPVDSPAVSPDGLWGFVASEAGMQQRLLDLRSGRELDFGGPKYFTNIRGAFSPNNRLVAVCYYTGQVEVYRLAERILQTSFQVADAGGIADMSFSADSRRILVAAGKSVRQFDVEQGQEVERTDVEMDFIRSVSLSADGMLSACAGGSYTSTTSPTSDILRVWNTESKKVLFRVHPERRTAASFVQLLSGNDRVLAEQSRRISIFSLSENKEIVNFPVSGGARSLAVSLDGKRLATGNNDKGLQIWDLQTGRLLHTLIAENAGFRGVAWTGDSQQILSAGQDGTARLWKLPDLTAKVSEASLPPPAAATLSVPPVLPPRVRLVLPPGDWPTAPLPQSSESLDSPVAKLVPIKDDTTFALAILADGKQLLAGGFSGVLSLFDLQSGDLAKAGREQEVRRMPINAIAVAPSGKWVVLAGGQYKGTARLIVWDLEKWTERFRMEGHEDAVLAVAVAADGKTIYSAGADHTLRVWNAENGASLGVLTGHQAPIKCLAIAPSGAKLVTVDKQGTALIWNVAENSAVGEIKDLGRVDSLAFVDDRQVVFAHLGASYAATQWNLEFAEPTFAWSGSGSGGVAASADGKWLAIAGQNRKVALWDRTAQRFTALLGELPPMVPALAFSPDGKQLAGGGFDANLRLWTVSPDR